MSKSTQTDAAKQDARKRFVEQLGTVMASLETRTASFSRLLPKDMDVEWFKGEVKVALIRSPGLTGCDIDSLFDSLTTCAQLGLSPSGRLGSAYLIPFGRKCQLIVGYKGLVDLAFRSGEIRSLGAEVVHANDVFHEHAGFGVTVTHERAEFDPGELRAAYAWVEIKGGGVQGNVRWARQILPIEQAALAKKREGQAATPWETHRAEQWRKTALRYTLKTAPLNPSRARLLAKAIEVEDEVEADWAEAAGEPDVSTAKGTQGLKERLKPRQALAADTTLGQRVEQTPEGAYAALEPTQAQVDAERDARGTT